VDGYPIKLGKVQRPSLRDETLARHRLLDWLDIKIHNRVVLVIADAGYGKTTLLADFSRRTRLRTIWYRMDEEDRNWVSFLSYLVAAGREHDPEFAPRTAALLADTGPGGANRDDALEAFLRELPAIAPDGATLILDDFHVADDVPDIKHIARELVARGPERLTLVFSSRRMPAVPVARLRARGEVAELRTADLRFSPDETEALFKETYGRPLDRDVLADLSRRTEGWAASLYLVQAALRDRTSSETRAFIRGLSGAQSDLYDYLAEEVVGDLPAAHQQFLMRTSILQSVDPDAARAVTQLDSATVASWISESERLGLLSARRDVRRTGDTYHPLVREFLESRLRRDAGVLALRELHRSVARWAESKDWRSACYHYAAAGDSVDLHRMLTESIEHIAGAGEVALAAHYLSRFQPAETTTAFEIIHARLAMGAVEPSEAVAHARLAVQLDPNSYAALTSLVSAYFLAGDLVMARELAGTLAANTQSTSWGRVVTGMWHILDITLDGSLPRAISVLTSLIEDNRTNKHIHYEGVSLLNRALTHKARGAADDALRDSADALDLFSELSAQAESTASELVHAWATAHLGRLDEARSLLARAAERANRVSRAEWLIEASEVEIWYGSEEAAKSLVASAADLDMPVALAPTAALGRTQFALRIGDQVAAARELPRYQPETPTQEPGHVSRYLAVRAHLAVIRGDPDASTRLTEAVQFAERQGALLWASYCRFIQYAATDDLDVGLQQMSQQDAVYLSMVAEVLIANLHRMNEGSLRMIHSEAASRPERWRDGLRRSIAHLENPSRLQAASILNEIGEASDVPALRAIARNSKDSRANSTLGRGLARRLAPQVIVEDQGRVEIRVASTFVPGTDLRRKVLAMLCFLLTRPRFSATRDEVIDALWPDMAPDVAVNSLNQTVYFLRRVFEPGYKEDFSAGYIHHASDVLWLDSDLIHSRSQRCGELLERMGPDPSPADVDRLSDMYQGRFALDFSYEEWAVPYRDALHVAYLHVIEGAVTRDIESGHFDRGIRLARRALDIDPDLENLQLSLLRLYRATGAHSAAAEQYAHYSAYLRNELGVEPPPLTAL
jgi:ATP/maltotriose-dependent transcriptional regulator MalT/DNA-binding SARP family transcriptional activator